MYRQWSGGSRTCRKNSPEADILTKALGRLKFKEMRELVGVQDLKHGDFKFKGENVG